MCEPCAAEYHDPADRRFHAQPTCCPACGPRLALRDRAGTELPGDPIARTAELLAAGQVLAVKGLGGYHLAVDAACGPAAAGPAGPQAPRGQAVRRAGRRPGRGARTGRRRRRRRRRSWPAAPAPSCCSRVRPGAPVAAAVAPGNRQLGVMLPYTPLHHLLTRAAAGPMVLTSGNVSDEPIAYRDADALDRLAGIADAFLTHDRAIHMRTDDSVARAFRGRPDAAAPVPRLCPRAGHGDRRLPAARAGLRRRAEEHVLPGQGPARLRLPPHRRPGERRNPAVLHRGHRALQAPVRHRPAGRRARPAPGVPVHQVRARPGRRGPAAGAAPPRAHRLLPGRQRRGRPGHRGGLRRHRLRRRRHDLGRRVPGRGPGRLRARRPPGAGADARRGRRHQAAVADGRRLPGRWHAAGRPGRGPPPPGPLARRDRHGRQGRQLPADLERRAAVRRRRGHPRRPGRDQLRGPGRDRARAAGRPRRDGCLPGRPGDRPGPVPSLRRRSAARDRGRPNGPGSRPGHRGSLPPWHGRADRGGLRPAPRAQRPGHRGPVRRRLPEPAAAARHGRPAAGPRVPRADPLAGAVQRRRDQPRPGRDRRRPRPAPSRNRQRGRLSRCGAADRRPGGRRSGCRRRRS